MWSNLKIILHFGMVAILFYQPLFYEPSSKAATKRGGARSAETSSSASTIYSSYLFILAIPVKQIPEEKISC
jgi:hypothetical protein